MACNLSSERKGVLASGIRDGMGAWYDPGASSTLVRRQCGGKLSDVLADERHQAEIRDEQRGGSKDEMKFASKSSWEPVSREGGRTGQDLGKIRIPSWVPASI